MRARTLLTLATCVFVVMPEARAQTPSPDQSAWRAQIETLLHDRARAVEQGDKDAFAATMTRAPKVFRDTKLRWFDRMRALPIETYTLEYSEDGYEDLGSGLAERPTGDEVHVVEVIERIGIAGFDALPSADELFLTVVRVADSWSIVSDTDLRGLGLLSGRNLWDFDPVGTIERSGVLVLYHENRPAAQQILTSTIEAVSYVQRRWPLAWRARSVVVIPKTASELSRLLRTTIDLGPFVAFTSSSVVREHAGYALVGHRISVQPETFFSSSDSFRTDTLSHEVLHLATRGDAGAWTPSWLDEGVAQVYGERAAQATDDLVRAVRSGALGGLPEDYRFFTGGSGQIQASYQASASFISFLRARYGSDAGARLYRALGTESVVSFGTARYHADHAVRNVFKTSLRALERAWLATLT